MDFYVVLILLAENLLYWQPSVWARSDEAYFAHWAGLSRLPSENSIKCLKGCGLYQEDKVPGSKGFEFRLQ
jgi:hypothetical protein